MKHSNKIKTVLVASLFACSGAACAQSYEEVAENDYQDVICVDDVKVIEEDEICEFPDVMAEFPGGQQALGQYLGSNIRYPEISWANGSQGRVFLKFVVNTDGSIQDIEVLRSSGDIYLDKEAIRVVRGMPKWTPGRMDGKIVRVRYVLPVAFILSK